MLTCEFVESCSLVNCLAPHFPAALKILRQRYCDGDHQHCWRYLRCGGGDGDSVMHVDLAWVRDLVESQLRMGNLVRS